MFDIQQDHTTTYTVYMYVVMFDIQQDHTTDSLSLYTSRRHVYIIGGSLGFLAEI